MFRLMLQFFIILALLLIGNSITNFFHLSVPGSIIGMVLLLIVLSSGLIKMNWVSDVANLHLKHMVLLFIPPIIGIFFSLRILQGQSWKLIVVLIISSLIGLVGIGYTAEIYEKFFKEEEK
ncbi:hypothetical protein PB1_03340 [Bacillus methanolicus PB1]|uniref:LrgA family protein n=1 Tax=Bacillus methanolicus PB1 TaxID=997296 RepID=I3E620_BACMT|nr:CidA/LrgA family protein [Bacillus methanolicus]EIJ81941.1 hypothetical protein PB1_03340 [Bacillus methanolicus PB1]